MSWGEDLKKIRRLLRDPNGNIWTDDYLLYLWNDLQKDFQHRTMLLEDFTIQRIPGLYQFSYMHDWEYENLPVQYSLFYRCLTQQGQYVVCHRWEPQAVTGIDGGVSDFGVHCTQPWEAFMGQTAGDVAPVQFPTNLRSVKFIAYDEKPLQLTTRKRVQSVDASYITQTGEPAWFWELDDVSHSYVLYPRPTTVWNDELDGNEGLAFYIEDDTEDVTTGTVATRTGGTGTDQGGAAFDLLDVTNNVFVIYDVDPDDLVNAQDESDFPEFMRKYIRYGVVSRAYGANTDGRIPSLEEYWGMRYSLGIKIAKRFNRNKKQDRDYRLTTKGTIAQRQRRHARLPDTYPVVKP